MEEWRSPDSHRDTNLQRHSSLFKKTCSQPVAEEDLHRLLDGIEILKLQHSESGHLYENELRTIRSGKAELNRRCNELHEHLKELSLELEAQVCCKYSTQLSIRVSSPLAFHVQGVVYIRVSSKAKPCPSLQMSKP